MSHTDKDRPYWVKLNDKGRPTDHDHRDFGKVVYKYKKVRDAKGHLVYEDVPIQYPARRIVGGIWGFSPYITVWPHLIEHKAMKTARLLVSAGEGDTLVTIRTESRVVTERVYDYTVADHCTEGEPAKPDGNYWSHRDMPCTPTLDWEGAAHWRSASTKKKRAYRSKHNGHSRTTARNTLSRMTHAANSGEVEWEDSYEEVELLTTQHRHSMDWDLW